MDYERTHTGRASFVAVARCSRAGLARAGAARNPGPRGLLRRNPESHLDKALFACDELAGFLTACALVKPTKSIRDVEVKGVLKKMKTKHSPAP